MSTQLEFCSEAVNKSHDRAGYCGIAVLAAKENARLKAGDVSYLVAIVGIVMSRK